MAPTQSPGNEEFPYSLQELESARQLLYEQIDFLSFFPAAEPTHHSTFTHRTRCPFHKEGGERTPSFYFSAEETKFNCFGCSMRGDCFDFLEAKLGRPWFFLVRDLLNKQGLTQLALEAVRPTLDRDLPHRIDLELSRRLRDYLAAVKAGGDPAYTAHAAWVESQFRRIDLRLKKLSYFKPQELLTFQMQMQLEIKRRTI